MDYRQRPPIAGICQTVDPEDHVGHGERHMTSGYDVGCADLIDVEVWIGQRGWVVRIRQTMLDAGVHKMIWDS